MTAECAAVEALADAWASIDGKLDGFRHGKAHPDSERAHLEGYYDGYRADASELIRRLGVRGFVVRAAKDGR